MPLSRKKSRSAGFYESTCCQSQIRIAASVLFPDCRICKSTAVWLPMDPIHVNDVDIEEISATGAERRQDDRRSGDRRSGKAEQTDGS